MNVAEYNVCSFNHCPELDGILTLGQAGTLDVNLHEVLITRYGTVRYKTV